MPRKYFKHNLGSLELELRKYGKILPESTLSDQFRRELLNNPELIHNWERAGYDLSELFKEKGLKKGYAQWLERNPEQAAQLPANRPKELGVSGNAHAEIDALRDQEVWKNKLNQKYQESIDPNRSEQERLQAQQDYENLKLNQPQQRATFTKGTPGSVENVPAGTPQQQQLAMQLQDIVGQIGLPGLANLMQQAGNIQPDFVSQAGGPLQALKQLGLPSFQGSMFTDVKPQANYTQMFSPLAQLINSPTGIQGIQQATQFAGNQLQRAGQGLLGFLRGNR